jgi:putative flippase GtrA
VEIIGLPILAAQAVVMFITIIISYTGHKYFSFKHNRNEIHQS